MPSIEVMRVFCHAIRPPKESDMKLGPEEIEEQIVIAIDMPECQLSIRPKDICQRGAFAGLLQGILARIR